MMHYFNILVWSKLKYCNDKEFKIYLVLLKKNFIGLPSVKITSLKKTKALRSVNFFVILIKF